MVFALHQQLVTGFANSFTNGENFDTIIKARSLAEAILNQKIVAGTPAAKLVDESVEQGLILAARQLVQQSNDPIQTWEQCLDLYERQPSLNTRTSTSILQQAYSTPVPIAFLAGKLASITSKTTVYEPTAGNGALLLLADSSKAIVNELNSDRAAALREQGFTVTEQDALSFIPQVESVDRIITNPPFSSLKDAQGQTKMFRRGRLTTSQLDHAIALSALDLMKPDGRAVLILGGKMGDESSRTERYNTQLTRGFYRWLYKDAGYKVADHFSLAGSLYRKQGTTFPIDVILIEGRGETQLKLPGVEPPRIYSSYEELKEVLTYATKQQLVQPQRNIGITLPGIRAGSSLDTEVSSRYSQVTFFALDDSISSEAVGTDRERGGIFSAPGEAGGVVNRANAPLEDNRRSLREVGSFVVGSSGDRTISSSASSIPQSQSNSQRNGDLFNNELLELATGSFRGPKFPSESLPDLRDRSELSREHESNRLVDVDEHGSEPPLFSGLETMAESNQSLEVNRESIEQDIENQVAYKPRSQAFSLSTLAPASSLKGLENAFNKIEAATGMSVDEYVRNRLNESSQEELFSHYAAEQIDSLALSIYNYEFENKATLIGHDTGIGKTRILCGLARYAQQQGMTPVIVTADSVLYADILARDAVDTGNSFNPLITNNDFHLTLRSADGRKIGEINTPENQGDKVRQCAQSGNIGEHDCVFTTYGQLTGAPSLGRRQLLAAIAPSSFLILDESHKAGGAAAETRPERKNTPTVPSCSDFFQQLVTRTRGFVASSATAIKDPIIASRLFYETTDLKLAAPTQNSFTDHLKAGSVPLQQMVFSMWAESGGCIRCEKSYEGVEFGVSKVPVSLQTAENNSKILNLIWQFDRAKETAVKEIRAQYADAGEAARNGNPAIGEAGASSTIFTSVLHNLTAVTSLGLKAEETANAAIADIEQGRKPILMLFNTMESTIKEFVDSHNELADVHNAEFPDSPIKRIEVGDNITIDAGQLFTRYLEKSRTIKITEPYLNELTGKNETRSHRLTDGELGEAGVATFNRAEAAIAEADWSQLPISPIDYIKQKIEDAGHSVGEITGRSHLLKYESANDLAAGVVTYSTRRSGTAQKKGVMDDFQNGRLDAIITNSTTGYSLHAARTAADQRQRVMYLVQPHLDVNQVEQSIGRSHRSGQLDPAKHAPDRLDENGQPVWGQYPGTFGLPAFKLVVGQDLPTEERAVAILMKKMSYLKANTTGNKSSSFGLKEMPDFINDYGNEVAQNLMEGNPQLHADLDHPLGHGEELTNPKAIQIVTGRAVMLVSNEPPTVENPYPSLERQAWLYDTLTSDYKEFLAQKVALGENELEAQKLDLQAEPKARLVLSTGDPQVDSPFTKPAYLVEVQAKTGAKPNTTLQVVNAVRQELGFEPTADSSDHTLFNVRETGEQVAQETVEQLRVATGEFLQGVVGSKEAEIAIATGKVEKYQQKFDAGTEHCESLQQQQAAAASSGNTELFEKLQTQLGQQQPKIDKLKSQLGKAKLDVNGKQFQLSKEQRNINATLEEVCALIKQFPVGQPVRLMDNETKNYLHGVVVGVEQKSKANNPTAPSNWKLKLLVVDGVRSLSVKFDSLTKNKQSLEPVEMANSFTNVKEQTSVYELFDQRQSEAKEKRYLVSGQVLATELKGKFAQVSDDKGQIHPVYLLRRGFDPAIDMNLDPVMLANPAQVKQFFERTQRAGVIKTADENLTVIADLKRTNEGGIVIKTPKATAQGGIYFKNEGLLQLTGDFVSKTESVRQGNNTKSESIMTVSVSADKTDSVLSYLCAKWGLGADSYKDVAREMLGQVLPSWEKCDEINPEAPRIAVIRSPQNARIDSLPSQVVAQEVAPSESNTQSDRLSTASEAITADADSTIATSAPNEVGNNQAVQIAPANNQNGAAEKNIAKLLHQAGLATEILSSDDFHLKVENKPFIPLVIERHGQQLYATHYLEDRYGDLFMDAEMVFRISSQGQLTLTETATQNPLNGGEYRSLDRGFAKTFSKNLLEQGFVEPVRIAFIEKQQSLLQPNQQEAEASDSVVVEVPEPSLPVAPDLEVVKPAIPVRQEQPQLNPQLIASNSTTTAKQAKRRTSTTSKLTPGQEPQGVQLSLFDVGLSSNASATKSEPQSTVEVIKENKPQVRSVEASATHSSSNLPPTSTDTAENLVDPMQIFQQVVDRVDKLTGEKFASMQSASPSVETLRDWYRAAQELNKSSKYLERISEIGTNFKQGEPLTEKVVATMQSDLQTRFKKLAVEEQINQLPDNEFLLLHQAVDNYFKAAPTKPPKEAEIQALQNEVGQLVNQINILGREQSDALATVEAMQNKPLRNWNGKYDLAVAGLEQTASKLENAIAHKQHKESQLGQWNKQFSAYQTWYRNPQTVEMRSFAQGFNSSQAMERLASIERKSPRRQGQLTGGQPRSDRGPGLSV